MREITGKVAKKFEKDFHGVKMYQFKLEDSDRWYKTGKEPLPAEEGECIKFQEKNGTVILNSVSTVDSVASVPEVSHSVKPTTQPVTATPGQRMAWEAARRDATNLVVAMLNADVTVEGGVLPWAKNTAKNKRMDLLLGYVNEIATTFMEEANGKV